MDVRKKCNECGKGIIDKTSNQNKKFCSKYCCQKNWRIKNKDYVNFKKREYDKKNSYSKKYYKKNKEKIFVNQKKYYSQESAKEKRRICANKNYALNKLKGKYSNKKYKQKRNKYLRDYTKHRRDTEKEYRIKELLRNRLFCALRDYTRWGKIIGSKKYGIDYDAIIKKLKPFPENIQNFHIEHIKPLCSFTFINQDGSQNLDSIKEAFKPENHRWLTIKQHKIKTAKEVSLRRKNEIYK